MDYWLAALGAAFAQSFEQIGYVDLFLTAFGGAIMIALKAAPWFKKWNFEPKHPAFSETWRLVAIFIIIFLICSLVIVPSRMFEEEHSKAVALQAQLDAVNAKLATADVAVNKSEDRAMRLSDALAMGKNDILDEPVSTVEITSTIQMAMADVEKPGLISSSGTEIVLSLDDPPSDNLVFTNMLLKGHCRSGESLKTRPSQAAYRFVCESDIDSVVLDKPIAEIANGKRIYIAFSKNLVPAGTPVLQGEIIFLINDKLRLVFEIPPQIVSDRGELSAAVLENLEDGMKPITKLPSSNPDKSTSAP